MSMIDEASSPKGRLWSLFRSHRGRPIHKWTQYFPAYERHLQRFVGTSPFMLEIGCGLGGSLEMWQTYFGEGCRIVGIDIRPECAEYARPEKGIEVRIGDQSDPRFLASLIEEFGIPDIVLDDGSHVMKHVNGTFDYLYEKTSPNGVYLVEDLHTAYWPRFGGGLRQPTSFIERSKGLLDEMHHRYTDGVVPATKFSESTESVHVYDSLIAFERQSNQRRIALEIGGEANDVRETTSIILNLSRGASKQSPEARPAAPPPAAPAVVTKPATMLHIHLAAMAPRFLDVRTHLPLRELAKVSGIATSSSERKIEFPRLPVDLPKIMILQRMTINNRLEWSNATKQLVDKGWVIVSEIDDHPELVGRVHGRVVDDDSWNAARLVHAVQTSTAALAGAMRPYNPEVAIFRNAVFTPAVPPRRRSGARLKVFYGALNREGFSAQVGAALAPFAAAHPDVEFVVVHDRAFFDALGACTKTFHPMNEDYAVYTALMAACDVCLMPLEGQPGELYKSDLKFIEASNLGLASIASPAVYGGTVVDSATGLIAADVQDWPRQLEKLWRDEALRQRLGESAQGYVARERQFSQQIGDRIAWYRDLWARKSDLGRALAGRVVAVESKRESQSATTG